MAAMKHRKLFPTPASTNQTDCPDFCDPYGDFYFMPPPPPPPPLSTAQAQPLSLYLIITVSLLGSFFLLLGYYLFVAKCCSRSPPTQSDSQDQDFLDENHGPEAIHHPIWFIRTVGLQPSVIDSITVFKYKKGDVLIEGSECSVCLSEFRDEETLRLLPKCNHAFHIPCIDTWLRSHTNCPLCRAGILSNTWSASNPSASNDQNRPNLGLQEETQVDNSDSNAELGNNRVSSSGINENRAETESEVELPRFEGERNEFDDPKDGVNSLSVVEPEGDSISRREDLQQSERDTVEIQDMENSTTNRVQIGGDSITQSVQKFPVSLKRSFSYGGSLFIPRHTRNSSSILPL